MPNWVYNRLHCHGSETDLDSLASFFEMEIEVAKYDPQTNTDNLVTETVPFTYMAMRNPFDQPYNVSPEEYHSVSGYSNGVQVGNTPGNWYNWNLQHWGVKWDASGPGVERQPGMITYSFESPWGPPNYEMLLEMSKKFPKIAFTHYYEEEQGWGGENEFQNGHTTDFREWDIPESHADHVEREQDCYCEIWSDDPNMWYADCPAKIEYLAKELQDA